jgi:hypothetical protein
MASFFKVIQGLYYLVSGTNIIASWLGQDYDLAQRATPPALNDSGTALYGLIGFQGGLHHSQKVDEDLWITRVPWEVHLRRNIPEGHGGRRRRETGPSGPAIVGGGGSAATTTQDVVFYLRVNWVDLSRGQRNTFQQDSFEFRGQEDFVEVTIDQMMAENQNPGASFSLYDSTVAPAPNPTGVSAAPQHPKYFSLIQPPEYLDVMTAMKLSWNAWLKPGPGMTRKELAKWFDPVNPNKVQFTIDPQSPASQVIDYDYFV